MAKNPESPLEPFKRALVNATRSLAESPDLEIVYSGEGPQLSGNRAVLPHPPRDLTEIDAARIRGFADQMALRIAHHDNAAHSKARPNTVQGQPIYDGIEQARLEAIGANALGGVRENLKAVHEQAWAKRAFNQVEALANPPYADIVSLMVRERLTGEKPPAMARPLVDLFRADVEAKAGPDLDRLSEAVQDQKAFARIARAIIRDLKMGEDMSDAPEQPDDEDGSSEEGEPDASEDNEEGDGEGKSPQQASMDENDATHRESEDADSQMMQAEDDPDADDSDEPPDMGEGEQPARPDLKGEGKVVTYKVFTTAHDEIVAAEELCDAEELTRLRAYLDQQLARACRTWSAGSPNSPGAAQAARPAEPRLVLRPGGRHPRRGAPDPGGSSTRPRRSASRKSRTRRVPRHRGLRILIDNSGSMRGRLIMVAAVCADIPARTLERCKGSRPRSLASPRGPGRGAHAREDWTEGRAAAAARTPERPAPHHLQGRGRAVAPRAPQPRPDDARGLAEGEYRRRGPDVGAPAADRLRLEARRILMVISDGVPVDDSTLSA